MQHHRNVFLVVLADILGTEAHRQVEVHLDGTALPVTTEAVLQREFELRAIEGTFTRVQNVVEASELRSVFEGGFSLVPEFIGTHALFRAGRELHDDFVESEVVVDFLHEGAEVSHFACNLFFGTEDVGVVLHKTAHAHQAVHGTGRFVTVALTEFGKAHRKVTPAAQTRVENLDVAGAVHRLHSHFHVASESLEHVLVVLVGVAGLDPQSLVHDFRSDHFEVATTVDLAADVVLEGVHHLGALRVPEHHARRMVFDMVEVHFLTDLAVVALFGFFEELQVSFEAFLVGKAGTVHAGQLVAVLVAMPVGTGEAQHLESLELARRGHVRTGTEVFPVLARFASHVEAEGAVAAFAGESAFSVIRLVLVAFGALQAFGGAHFAAGKRTVFLDDFLHALFDALEIRLLDRCGSHQIVVETLVDSRTVGELGAREQVADGFGQHVAAAVAQQHQSIGVVVARGDDADSAAFGERAGKVQDLVAELDAQSFACETFRNALCNFEAGGARCYGTYGAIGEGEFDLRHNIFLFVGGSRPVPQKYDIWRCGQI